MAFTSFKNLNEVVTTYKLYYDVANFITIQKQPIRIPSQHLIETLDFNLNETVYDISEKLLFVKVSYIHYFRTFGKPTPKHFFCGVIQE